MEFFWASSLGAVDWAAFDWDWVNERLPLLAFVLPFVAAVLVWLWRIPKRGKRPLPEPMVKLPKRTVFGRDKDAADLRAALVAHGQTAVVPVRFGGGGVGKTTLCLHYARVYAGEYDRVEPLRAGTETELIADLARLACTLDPSLDTTRPARELAQIAQQMVEASAATQRWLLIYDNVERPQIMHDWGVRGRHLHVLVTSRHPDWTMDGYEAKSVEVLSPEAATAFLRAEARREVAGLEGLAEFLGYLPLSLVQAGEWLRTNTSSSVADYTARIAYLSKRVKVPDFDTDLNRTTAAVVEETLARLSPDARALARIFAWFAPDQLSAELVLDVPVTRWWARQRSEIFRHQPRRIYAMARAPKRLDAALGQPRQLALLDDVADAPSTYRMHRDFQRIIRSATGRRGTPRFGGARAASAVLAVQMPPDANRSESWPGLARLAPHAQDLRRHAMPLWHGPWRRPKWWALKLVMNKVGIFFEKTRELRRSNRSQARRSGFDPRHAG